MKKLLLLLFTTLLWGFFLWKMPWESENHFPVTDWIIWENKNNQWIVKALLPPLAKNPIADHSFIQEGWELKKIDLRPIEQLSYCEALRNKTSGDVLLYTLMDEKKQLHKGFIFLSPQPRLLWHQHNWTWQLAMVFFFLFSLGMLPFLSLLFPFKNQYKIASAITIVVLYILMALLQETRLLWYQYDYNLSFNSLHIQFYRVYLSLWAVLATFLFLHFWYKRVLWNLFFAMLSGLTLFVLIPWSGYQAETLALLEYTLARWWLWLVVVWVWQERQKWYFNLATIVTALLLELFPAYLYCHQPTISVSLLFWISTLFPLVPSATLVIRYGKVQEVAVRSSFFIFLLLIIGGIYWALYQISLRIGLQPQLLFILLLFITLILALSGYGIYQRILPLWLQTQQRKTLMQWKEKIFTYAQAQQLIKDFKKQLQNYFNTSVELEIYDKNHLDTLLQRILFRMVSIHPEGVFWSAMQALNEIPLTPNVQKPLIEKGIVLLCAFAIGKNQIGVLSFKKKPRGTYTYGDKELLRDLVKQVGLALQLFFLIERQHLLEQRTLEAELAALRSQINPHFLFNTLNTIIALIHENPTLAEEAITELAYVFRYTFEKARQDFVSLQEELSLVRSYLHIVQIRFGKRLKVAIEVPKELYDYKIPTLMVQTIVENSVKHGISKIRGQGYIYITAEKDGDFIKIVVEDNGPGIDLKRLHQGTGIRNILERMQYLFNRSDLIIFQNTGKGTRVILQFPILGA